MRNSITVRNPLLVFLLLVVQSNVFAEEYIKLTGTLVGYEKAHWHAHEIVIVDEEGREEGTLTADSVCPRARFKVINPKNNEEVEIDIIFLYRSMSEKLKSEFEEEGSVGTFFYVDLPEDFFEGNHGWIYFDAIGEINKMA
ncbi:MAG: hypothetical protein AB3N64_04995 [Puniceicoccaceae bacterium]